MADPERDLHRRLRANRGRLHRPQFTARVERALGTRVTQPDVLDLETTDRLAENVAAHLKVEHPTQVWPESQRAAVFARLGKIAESLSADHVSCLTYFRGWDELGALRLNSADACAHLSALWDEGAEPVCLIAEDFSDGLYLDYTEADQANRDDGEGEYELWVWGAFAD